MKSLSVPDQDRDRDGIEHRLNLDDTAVAKGHLKAQEQRPRFAVQAGEAAPANPHLLGELYFQKGAIRCGNGWIATRDGRRSVATAEHDENGENCTFHS